MACRGIAGFDGKSRHGASPVGRDFLSWWASRMVALLLQWQGLARQRRRLGQLSEHMLADIGISRAEAQQEAERPFWDGSNETWRGR